MTSLAAPINHAHGGMPHVPGVPCPALDVPAADMVSAHPQRRGRIWPSAPLYIRPYQEDTVGPAAMRKAAECSLQQIQ